MQTRIVNWITNRGFGFVNIDGQDAFINIRDIFPSPRRGINLAGLDIYADEVISVEQGLRVTKATMLPVQVNQAKVSVYYSKRNNRYLIGGLADTQHFTDTEAAIVNYWQRQAKCNIYPQVIFNQNKGVLFTDKFSGPWPVVIPGNTINGRYMIEVTGYDNGTLLAGVVAQIPPLHKWVTKYANEIVHVVPVIPVEWIIRAGNEPWMSLIANDWASQTRDYAEVIAIESYQPFYFSRESISQHYRGRGLLAIQAIVAKKLFGTSSVIDDVDTRVHE